MARNVEAEMADIIRTVIENGRAATQEELEVEFEFEAVNRGWADEEIQAAIQSPWFPQI